jgi:hypothetical protein
MPETHAKLSASGASRWLACPASPRISAGIPSTTSPYAAEGTQAHEMAEVALTRNVNAAALVGERPEWTAEMAEAVQVYLDFVREILACYEDAEIDIESRVSLAGFGRSDMFGTADCVISTSSVVYVIDYKHGAGVAVEVEDNPQLLYYAAGALCGTGGYQQEVEMLIVQPRAFHPDGPIRRWRTSVEDVLFYVADVLIPGALATEKPDALPVPGKHCRWCPAFAICSANKQQIHAIAPAVFSAVAVDGPPFPDRLTPAEIRKVLDVASQVEAWIEAVRNHAKTALESGTISPDTLGWKLVAGRATRKWQDETSATQWLEAILGELAYERKLLSPAKAEKALKGDAKKAVKELTEETRGTVLAPLDDKREAVSSAASLTFEAVDV